MQIFTDGIAKFENIKDPLQYHLKVYEFYRANQVFREATEKIRNFITHGTDNRPDLIDGYLKSLETAEFVPNKRQRDFMKSLLTFLKSEGVYLVAREQGSFESDFLLKLQNLQEQDVLRLMDHPEARGTSQRTGSCIRVRSACLHILPRRQLHRDECCGG